MSACAVAIACHAQEKSLRECIDIGIANNLTLANARIGIDKGHTTLSQNRSRLLPVISAGFTATDYLKRPANVTTGTRLGSDFPDDPTWQAIHSMQYNATAGIMLNVPLFDRTIFTAIDVAKTIESISSLSYEKAVEDLTVQIGKVYYMAQASLEQERLADRNIERMEELCAITEALYQQGVVLEVDLNRVRINLQNLRTLSDQSHTLHAQQLNTLRYLLDIDIDTPLEVTRINEEIEPLEVAGISNRLPELLLYDQKVALAEKNIRSVRAGYLPSVSFTGYAGTIGYQESLHDFFHTSAAKDNWFGNCYIALSIRIPIFDANAKRLQITQHRHDAQQAANDRQILQNRLDQTYANAILQLNHNIEVFRTQSDSRRQAQDVYNVTEEQYKEGVASMTALLQDEMQLRSAQSACVLALCQCRLARLDLLKLSGNLSQLTR